MLVAVAAATLGGGVSWHYATEHSTAPIEVYAQRWSADAYFCSDGAQDRACGSEYFHHSRVVRTSAEPSRGRGRQPQTPEDLFGELFGGRGFRIPEHARTAQA